MRPLAVSTALILGTSLAVSAAPAKKSAKPAPKKAAPAPAKPQPKAPQELRLGNVSSRVPGEWAVIPPDGQFRAAQYAIPRATGDTAQALFIVFHFGKGGGGGVEDNVRRWVGMMKQPDGSDTTRVLKRAVSDREGLRIHTADIPGTYLERPFPRSEEFTERPNYRMLAAIIETTKEGGDGPYFVRLVGPAKSIEAAKPGWDAFIASLKWE